MKKVTISSAEALKRKASVPSSAILGPSASGKSTLINSVVNLCMAKVTARGVGENGQTTLIPCNMLLDERIASENEFAIQIKMKSFDKKSVSVELQDQLCDQFCKNAQDIDDTIDALTEEWLSDVLEPTNAAFHLSAIKDELDLEVLKEKLSYVLHEMQNFEESFSDLVKKKKKEVNGQKIGAPEIRRMVFEDLWCNISKNTMAGVEEWLEQIGNLLKDKLSSVFKGNQIEEIMSFQLNSDGTGELVLSEILNPQAAYSLIISEIDIACRPREELINNTNNDIPFRFCFRDTVGLTQEGTNGISIRNALDIALNSNSDSLLLLLSLTERNDVLVESCKMLAEKLTKANKLDIPVYILFTKADSILETKIAHKIEGKLVTTQNDYDSNIMMAISELENYIESIIAKIPPQSVKWISMRYKQVELDPIQKALVGKEEYLGRFKPQGLYEYINQFTEDIQARILPEGVRNPIFVTVKDNAKLAVEIKLCADNIKSILDNISETLTNANTHKDVVNGYQITTSRIINGRSVTTYWRKLFQGLGHTTNATVYGNFSINMKGLLNKVLCDNFESLLKLYEYDAVATIADNVIDDELNRMVSALDESKDFSNQAFKGINPEVVSKMTEHEKNMQILHYIFRVYFSTWEKKFTLLNRVAYQLTCGNGKIQRVIIAAYNEPLSYDETIRHLQKTFLKIYKTEAFKKTIVEEMEKVMTDYMNKIFILI